MDSLAGTSHAIVMGRRGLAVYEDVRVRVEKEAVQCNWIVLLVSLMRS